VVGGYAVPAASNAGITEMGLTILRSAPLEIKNQDYFFV
jgi:hypothetical protein